MFKFETDNFLILITRNFVVSFRGVASPSRWHLGWVTSLWDSSTFHNNNYFSCEYMYNCISIVYAIMITK